MIKIILFMLLSFVALFLWCSLKISSETSKIEEKFFQNDDYSKED